MNRRLLRAFAALSLTASLLAGVTAVVDAVLTPADTTWGAPATEDDTTWGNPPANPAPADTASTPALAVDPLDTTWG